MKSVWITKPGDGSVLEVRETADVEPKRGEVCVRVMRCGLNFADVSARQGLYPDAPKPPSVVGYEGAGVVQALGPDVEGPPLGSRVLYLSNFGGHADRVCVPAAQVVAMPAEMSFEHGAALGVNYLTAYHMLFQVARIRAGEHVLVHMAAGGVGTAVLQLCQTVPEVVTYGTASAHKHAYLREHGCSHPIDYHQHDYVTEVRRLSGGRGMDVVLDPLGGKDWRKGYELLGPAGMLVAFGLANTNTGGKRKLLHVLKVLLEVPKFNVRRLLEENKAVAGVHIGHLWQDKRLLRSHLSAIIALYNQHRIRPHVGAVFPFSEAAKAFAEVEYGRNLGKVLLAPDEHFER